MFRGGLTLGGPGERGSALARWRGRGRASRFVQNRLGSSTFWARGVEVLSSRFHLKLSAEFREEVEINGQILVEPFTGERRGYFLQFVNGIIDLKIHDLGG